MSNMHYCRFANTYRDLKECLESIESEEELSEIEAKYKIKLIGLCREISNDYEED
jgi:hypothetical protein